MLHLYLESTEARYDPTIASSSARQSARAVRLKNIAPALILQRKVGNKSRKARQFGLAVGQVSDVVAFLVVSHHA